MKAQKLAMVGVLVALLSVSAFIRIPVPFLPMPFTMQVLVVLIAPMLVGACASFAAVAFYIMLGLLGAPVFSSGGGIAYVLTPSFGFLIGFLLSTIPGGLIAKNDSGFGRLMLAGVTGLIVIHLTGGIGFWLNLNLVQGKNVSLIKAAYVAVLPFLPVDFVKVICAAVIARKLRPVIRGIKYS